MSWLSYEMNGTSYEFDDMDDLREAYAGNYGDDWQTVAAQAVTNLEAAETQEQEQFSQQEAGASDEQWQTELIAEIERLEQKIGRSTTGAEQRYIRDNEPAGELSDIVAKYEQELGGRVNDDRSRQALTAEVAAEHMEPDEESGLVYQGANNNAGGSSDE
jgi:hypothetical protein